MIFCNKGDNQNEFYCRTYHTNYFNLVDMSELSIIVSDSIQVTINSILTCVIRSIISGHDGRYRSITAAEGIIGWLRETVTFTILQIVPFPMDSQWPPCLGPSESQSVFHSVSIVISNQSHTYPIPYQLNNCTRDR